MLYVKALHIVAVVTWFAGLFYLPRLFVYHAMTMDEPGKERFKIMERKLYRGIMTPSLIVTVILGLSMLIPYWSVYKTQIWVHVKLTLVLLLIGYHLYCGQLLKAFAKDRNRHGHVFYRWFNEIPVIFLIAIALLVVVKPF
ncbi:MAG: protoporphyrinogen oxidase HemJ [Pseudomonadales bacterium]|nr:protoporphyrinogen oxidase HemJ [Pseudomonadales bacterium]